MSNRILSYKGLLADGGQDTILLSTKKGEIGYRIKKFQVFPSQPGQVSYESVVQLWKESQSSISTSAVVVDFSDNRLLGAGYYGQYSTISSANQNDTVVFDQEIFNQDIYVTHTNVEGAGAANEMNYYLELEIIKLSEDQAMVATLKDIRNNS